MLFWNQIDTLKINVVPHTKDRSKYTLNGSPLRFQIPRSMCKWGVSSYKAFQVEISNEEFLTWWRDLESKLSVQEPFVSNLKGATLRLKIDDSTYIFDENSKQVSPEVQEGLFREQELSCIVDIDSNYFYNGNWGLIVRAYQVLYYGPEARVTPEPTEAPILKKGVCAFLTD
jgi:hypothetical protein